MSNLPKVLVVVDNANDLVDFAQFRNLLKNVAFHLLLTSRVHPDGWSNVEIRSLPQAEGVLVFRKYHSSVQAADKDIAAIVEQLFNHTLLIELVAKAAAANNMPFDRLQKALQSQSFHAADINRRKIDMGGHGDSLDENQKFAYVEPYIFAIYENISELSDAAKAVLRAFALLPTATPIDEDKLIEHLESFDLKDDLIEILDTTLEKRGWLDKHKTDEGIAYSLHPLIAEVVVKHLEVDAAFADAYIYRIANVMDYNNADPKNNLFDKKPSEPFAERLVNLFFDKNTEGVSELLHSLNWYHQQWGYYDKALRYGERALQITESLANKDENVLSERQNTLALLYRNLGRYNEAAQLLEKTLDKELNTLGDKHSEVATTQSNLALVCQDLGRYDEAAQLLEWALKSDSKNFGQEHPTVANRQSNLATVYRNLRRYDEAAILAEKALASDEKNFGKEHPIVSTRQVVLAYIYKPLGRYDEAAQLLERALKSDIKNFGQEHPNVATRQNNLASVYRKLGLEAEAQAFWQKAYQIFLNVFGEEHPSTKIVKKNMASIPPQ